MSNLGQKMPHFDPIGPNKIYFEKSSHLLLPIFKPNFRNIHGMITEKNVSQTFWALFRIFWITWQAQKSPKNAKNIYNSSKLSK